MDIQELKVIIRKQRQLRWFMLNSNINRTGIADLLGVKRKVVTEYFWGYAPDEAIENLKKYYPVDTLSEWGRFREFRYLHNILKSTSITARITGLTEGEVKLILDYRRDPTMEMIVALRKHFPNLDEY